MKRGIRVSLFYLGVVSLIITSNNGYLVWFLDGIVATQWSSKIVEIIRSNTQGLLVALLIAIYFDFVKGDKTQEEVSRFIEELKHNHKSELLTGAKTKIRQGLMEIVGSDRVEALANAVVPRSHKYKSVSVDIELEECSDDPASYWYRYQYSFTADIDRMVIAVTNDASVQSAIFSYCKNVNESIKVDNLGDCKGSNYDSIAKQFEITCSTGPKHQKLSLEPIAQSQYSHYLSGIPASDYSKILLFASSCINNDSDNRFSFKQPDLKLNKNGNFIYWVSDRPIQLESIKIDASLFDKSDKTDFSTLTLFSGIGESISYSNKRKKVIIKVDSWLPCGNSVIFSWSSIDESQL